MRIPQNPTRKVAQVAVVMLLVSASLGGPAVDTATAIHECSTTDALVAMFTFTAVNNDKCTDSHRAEAIREMQQADANATKVDLWQAAIQQEAEINSKLNVRENYLQDSQTPAWNKGEAAYIQARQENSHEYARAQARTAVRDYYSRQQVNMLANWEFMVQQFRYLRSKAEAEQNISTEFVTVYYDRNRLYDDSANEYTIISGFPNVTVELENGSTKTVTGIEVKACDEWGIYTGCDTTVITPDNPGSNDFTTTKGGDNLARYNVKGLQVRAPDKDYNATVYTRFDRWHTLWTNLTAAQDRLNDNINKFTDSLNQGVENGTVDLANVTSAQTLAQEYSTQYNETGYWSYSVARLSALGLSAPDLNGTSQMTVQSGGQTYTGMLMSQEAPDNGTWKVGKTYDAANISGMQIMVTLDGSRHELQGEFTITNMTNEQGERINSTSIQTYSYKTTNTTEYVELQQELRELQAEIEEEEPKAGGGSGGDGSGGLGDQGTYILGGAVAALLLVMLVNRD